MKERWLVHKECMYYLSENLLDVDEDALLSWTQMKRTQRLMRGYGKRIMFRLSHVDQENI